FIERLMPLEKFPDILDLACGTGRHSIELASRGYNVTGVDINVQALRNAAGIAAASNLDVRFLPADLRELYYIDGRFNGIVIFWENFGFQDGLVQAGLFSQLQQLMYPGSRLILDLLNGLHYSR